MDASYFGEGLRSSMENHTTYLARKHRLYLRLESMAMERSFTYDQSKEGWGLCNDGTSCINRMERENMDLGCQLQKETSYIEVTTHKTILTKINELEWVKGTLYANTYQGQKDVVVIINPRTVPSMGSLILQGSRDKVEQIPRPQTYSTALPIIPNEKPFLLPVKTGVSCLK